MWYILGDIYQSDYNKKKSMLVGKGENDYLVYINLAKTRCIVIFFCYVEVRLTFDTWTENFLTKTNMI